MPGLSAVLELESGTYAGYSAEWGMQGETLVCKDTRWVTKGVMENISAYLHISNQQQWLVQHKIHNMPTGLGTW